MCTYARIYLCHTNGKSCQRINYSIFPQIASQCKCIPESMIQTCPRTLPRSVILHHVPKANRAWGSWCFTAAPDSHPLISSPPAFSLKMPLITDKPVARKPENKTWVLETLLCWMALAGAVGEEVQLFQVVCNSGGGCGALGSLQAIGEFVGMKTVLLVAGASPGSILSSPAAGVRGEGEGLPFQNIC